MESMSLVSVRGEVESSESFVIQVWWPDSRRVTDVDGEEPQTIRPQCTTISERSDRRGMGACGFVDPTGQAGGNKRHVDVREVMNGIMKDVPALESAGVVLRMPASWRMNHPARPQVKATVGGNAPSQLGMDALLDFRMEVTLEGESLSKAEIKRLLAHSDGLVLIRGKWVEVDHERLKRTLEQFEAIERRAAADGLSFGEAMRMLAGAGIAGDKTAAPADIDWSQTVAGPWLAETLATLRHPDWLTRVDPRQYVQGTLRPYQQSGVQWLYLLTQLKLGACRRYGARRNHPGVVAAAGDQE